jgi:SAM-dependent methyltransferase
LIKEYKPDAESILDLGCGTGRHAKLLFEKGYVVCGVDRSEDMLSVAMQNPANASLIFKQGDVRSVRLNRSFDVVVSLFHVMSYQTSNDDLIQSFATAYEHLNSGGVFIFDFWYGPAVLTDRPTVRIKRLEDENVEVTRLAEPVLHANENIVDVNYHVLIRNKKDGHVEELKETHYMRYLFKPEVDLMLKNTGFQADGSFEYMTGGQLDYDTWNACFVARKK